VEIALPREQSIGEETKAKVRFDNDQMFRKKERIMLKVYGINNHVSQFKVSPVFSSRSTASNAVQRGIQSKILISSRQPSLAWDSRDFR
jgi:hypothetical protein